MGKNKNHIEYQNRKTARIFYENRKPDAKKMKNPQTAMNTKTEKPKSLAQKPKHRSKN